MARSGIATAGDVLAFPQGMLEVFSMDMEHEAVGASLFAQFAIEQTELGKVVGEKVTFTRYANMTRGTRLKESSPIVARTLSATQRSLIVDEFGNAIELTDKLLKLSYDDLLAECAFQLGRDMTLVMDNEYRLALMGGDSLDQLGAVRVSYTGLPNEIYANGRADLASVRSTDRFTVEEIRNAVEVLQTNNAPKYNGDFYACFCHPHQIAHLKRDPDWQSANNYANTRDLFTGEAGRFEDVIFMVTTNMNNGVVASTADGYDAALDGTGVDGANLYKAVVLGDGCLGWAQGQPAEMRTKGIQDYGRSHGMAWHAIWGYGLIFENNGVSIVTG
jgi:N4-gp56 family major capsid protein